MRRVISALAAGLAAAALAGCVETLQSAYDDRAYDECDNASGNARAHSDCYDRVDANRRAHSDN